MILHSLREMNIAGSIFQLCMVCLLLIDCKGGQNGIFDSEPVIFDQVEIKGTDMGIVHKYDSLGHKQIEGTVIHGKKNGAWVNYNSDGVVLSVMNYIDDKKNGFFLKLSENKLDEVGSYKDDLRDGTFLKYLYGHLDESIEYKHGKQNGWAKKYYLSGGVQKELEMKDDVQHGTYRFYREDGTVMVEEVYKEGKKISGGIVK